MPHEAKPSMSAVRYLVRFDDICPTMNWRVWNRIESALSIAGIRPILAVVPDNQDPKLQVDLPAPEFWSKVREWQARGWTIALHGYQHLYVSGDAGLMGINKRSEFAGLPIEIQRKKLEAGLDCFRREGVSADVWVAPAHSFDLSTITGLKDVGIQVISDGFAYGPYAAHGMTWVPQQLWDFRRFRSGTWTVCFHPNSWSESDFDRFLHNIREFRDVIVSMPEVLAHGPFRSHRFSDRMFDRTWRAAMWSKRRIVRGIVRRVIR